ncbi:hypothetical protein IMU39_004222 [Salmonella enterica]|nr:hypothetical protein [Salmonella enterica]EIG7199717.1 hypothetical protein [Salmonella enterica]EIS1933379.1 hypothetical protein [Salmonella enterica]EJQ2072779.1 hypothetical protein [Salmonella enterica]
METLTITNAQNHLLKVDTGILRRLLYLASGSDVGCSLGLFWSKCDSFYLVDPEFGKSIQYDSIIEQLRSGTAGYMEGCRILVESYQEGRWVSAFPGRRYYVYMDGMPSVKKRLYFVCAGSNAWLSSTTSHYSVVLNKDYAGIENSDDRDYPYERVWGRLNQNGIFGETIGPGRSDEASDFASYRYRGLMPLIKVTRGTGEQLGFASGLVLFQKQHNGSEEFFIRCKSQLEAIYKIFEDKFEIFMMDFGPSAIKGNKDYAELHSLMTQPDISNWQILSTDKRFADWLISQLPPEYAQIDPKLLFDILSPLQFGTWGNWEKPEIDKDTGLTQD